MCHDHVALVAQLESLHASALELAAKLVAVQLTLHDALASIRRDLLTTTALVNELRGRPAVDPRQRPIF